MVFLINGNSVIIKMTNFSLQVNDDVCYLSDSCRVSWGFLQVAHVYLKGNSSL